MFCLVKLYGKLYRYSKLYVLISVCKFWLNTNKTAMDQKAACLSGDQIPLKYEE